MYVLLIEVVSFLKIIEYINISTMVNINILWSLIADDVGLEPSGCATHDCLP